MDYIIDKFSEYPKMIDHIVWNIFKKGMSLVVLIYIHGFNLCNIRDEMINKVKTDTAYSRCSTVEI